MPDASNIIFTECQCLSSKNCKYSVIYSVHKCIVLFNLSKVNYVYLFVFLAQSIYLYLKLFNKSNY